MLARKSLLAFGTDIVKAIIGFASTYFIAHYLGVSALGSVGYLLGLLGTFALVSDLGLHQAFRKCAAENPNDNAGYVTALLLVKILLGALLIGAYLVAPQIDQRLAAQLANADVRGAYWAIAVYYLFNNLAAIPALTFQARRETAKFTLPSTVGALISSVAKIVMALAHVSLTGLAIAYTLETAAGLLVSLWMFRGYTLRRPHQDEFRHLFGYARPMLWVTALAYILPNVDRVILERCWNTQEVGYYTAVLGLVALMQRVPLAAMGVFLPQASEDAAKGNLQEMERRLFVIERYLLMITVPLCIAVALASAPLARLYLGEEFVRSGPILAVLAFTPLLVAFFEPYDTVVYAVEKHRYLVFSGMLSLVVLLTVDMLLVPHQLFGTTLPGLGGLGAALGNLASQAVNGVLQVYLARRYARVGLFWRGSKFILAGLGMAAVSSLILHYKAPGMLWATLLAVVAGGAAYLLALVLLHEFTWADARLFLDLFHPTKMTSYVRMELGQTSRPDKTGGK